MASQWVGYAAPEVVALCRSDDAGKDRVIGWAMVVAERVVAYVPEDSRVPGGGLLNTYSSLDAVDRRLAYADIYSVRNWAALLTAPPARRTNAGSEANPAAAGQP